MGMATVQRQVRVPVDLDRRLNAHLASAGGTAAGFIRKAIREALDRAGAPPADTEVDA